MKLLEAVDQIPMMINLWDEQNNLFFANQFSKKYHETNGISLKKGTTLRELAEKLVKAQNPDNANGKIRKLGYEQILNTDEGIDNEQYKIEKYLEFRKNLKGKVEYERILGDKILLATDQKLSDGGVMTTGTDITDLKKSQQVQEDLFEAVNEVPIIINLWDENDQLIFANNYSKSFNSKYGIYIDEGIKVEDLWSQILDKEKSRPKIISNNQKLPNLDFVDQRKIIKEFKQFRDELKDKVQFERYMENITLLVTEKRLSRGGILSTQTDISELKEQQ